MVKSDSINIAPPISVFIIAILLAIVILLVFYVQMPIDVLDNANTSKFFHTSRLDKFANSDGKLKVVVVGTSLSMCALYFDNEMEAVAKQVGLDISYVRFTLKGGSLYNDYLNLFDQIISIKPDIVIIESSFFGVKSKSLMKYFVRSHTIFIKSQIKEWIMMKIPIHLTIDDDVRFDMTENYIDYYSKKDKTNINVNTKDILFFDYHKRKRILDFEYGIDFKDYFDRFSMLKIKVALVDIPISKELFAILPEGFEDRYDSLMNRYVKEYGVKHMKLPYRLDSIYFKDFYHLNIGGRRMFSAWFVEQLKTLKEGDRDNSN